MTGIVCAIVGSFSTVAAAQIIRYKKGIQAIGNAQVDTAQSKFGSSSALFDGTGDYLFSPSNSDFGFGTSDFTIEGWIRFVNFTSGPVFVDMRAASGTEVKPVLYVGGDGRLYYYVNGAARITGNILSTNTWYHIALSRSGTSTKLFQDGTQAGSTYTDTNNYPATVLSLGIASWNTSFSALNGHIDEFRVSNTARYTANFTPSTTPFVNDDNTLLLLHMNGTDASTFFEDDNGVRLVYPIITTNQAQISTAQSKFGGSSALFDAANDYLATWNPISGTGDFTIEFWFRRNSIGVQRILFDARNSSYPNNIAIYWTSDNKLHLYAASGNRIDSADAYTSTTTWYHLALARSNGVTKMFIDGTQIGSNYSDLNNYSNVPTLIIGASYDGSGSIDSYLDEIRISNSARYTTNFTAPTAPFVNDDNTVLLLHCDGTNASTVFRDDNGTGRAAKGIYAIGNAQIDNAQSKFGGTSLVIANAAADNVRISNDYSDLRFGTGDFTIEGWFRPGRSNYSTAGDRFWYSKGVNTTGGILLGVTTGGVRFRSGGTTDISYSTTLSSTTWYHIAWTRSGNTRKIWIDGTEVATDTLSFNVTDTNPTVIGAADIADANYLYGGWIDEVRISNTARYTANFTPSTTQFSNDANTLLLLHMDGTDASTVFIDDNGKHPVTP